MEQTKASDEIKVGKYQIGWVSGSLNLDVKIEKRPTPTYTPLKNDTTFCDLPLCDLSDVVAFLKDPPQESKDGYGNYFKCGSVLVFVFWFGDYREWLVDDWDPDYGVSAGRRVFSGNLSLKSSASDTLSLESLDTRLKKLEALVNPTLL